MRRELTSRRISASRMAGLNVWVAREMPFVPETMLPLVTSAPTSRNASDFHFQTGLIDWFVNRWVTQNSSRP